MVYIGKSGEIPALCRNREVETSTKSGRYIDYSPEQDNSLFSISRVMDFFMETQTENLGTTEDNTPEAEGLLNIPEVAPENDLSETPEKDESEKAEMEDKNEEHAQQLSEMFGGSPEDWTPLNNSSDNVAYLHIDGNFYFNTDTNKEYPLDLDGGLGQLHLYEVEENIYGTLLEQIDDHAIAIYSYQKIISVKEEREEKNNEILLDEAIELNGLPGSSMSPESLSNEDATAINLNFVIRESLAASFTEFQNEQSREVGNEQLTEDSQEHKVERQFEISIPRVTETFKVQDTVTEKLTPRKQIDLKNVNASAVERKAALPESPTASHQLSEIESGYLQHTKNIKFESENKNEHALVTEKSNIQLSETVPNKVDFVKAFQASGLIAPTLNKQTAAERTIGIDKNHSDLKIKPAAAKRAELALASLQNLIKINADADAKFNVLRNMSEKNIKASAISPKNASEPISAKYSSFTSPNRLEELLPSVIFENQNIPDLPEIPTLLIPANDGPEGNTVGKGNSIMPEVRNVLGFEQTIQIEKGQQSDSEPPKPLPHLHGPTTIAPFFRENLEQVEKNSGEVDPQPLLPKLELNQETLLPNEELGFDMPQFPHTGPDAAPFVIYRNENSAAVRSKESVEIYSPKPISPESTPSALPNKTLPNPSLIKTRPDSSINFIELQEFGKQNGTIKAKFESTKSAVHQFQKNISVIHKTIASKHKEKAAVIAINKILKKDIVFEKAQIRTNHFSAISNEKAETVPNLVERLLTASAHNTPTNQTTDVQNQTADANEIITLRAA